MRNLPAALEPLDRNRRELLATLDLIDQTREPIDRADLASELVGICARYEDVKERVVYPALRATSADTHELDQAENDQKDVREALGEIRRRTQHVKPSNAHADDSEGFEAALLSAVNAIRAHVEHEDELLLPLLAGIDEQASDRLRKEVEHAVAHASTHPNPPHNPIGRAYVAIEEMLERHVHDESTSFHPGVESLDEELARSAPADDPPARS